MGGKEWPSILQKLFLVAWMARYLEAAATGSYTKFWPLLYEAWFKVNRARLASLPDLETDSLDLHEGGSDDEEAPDEPSSEKHIALIHHLRGLTPEGRLAWQVQQGLLQDQAVRIGLLLVYKLSLTLLCYSDFNHGFVGDKASRSLGLAMLRVIVPLTLVQS